VADRFDRVAFRVDDKGAVVVGVFVDEPDIWVLAFGPAAMNPLAPNTLLWLAVSAGLLAWGWWLWKQA
jgi:hypothetical protein